MARELSEAEKFFILHSEGTNKQVASEIPGVGVKTVEKFRKENTVVTESLADNLVGAVAAPPADNLIPQQADPNVARLLALAQQNSQEVSNDNDPTPPPQPNQFAGMTVGDLIGRRQNPDGSPDRKAGIVVMTPAASELSDDRKKELARRKYKENDDMPDARDVLAIRHQDPQAAHRNRNRIHKIRPDEPSQ